MAGPGSAGTGADAADDSSSCCRRRAPHRRPTLPSRTAPPPVNFDEAAGRLRIVMRQVDRQRGQADPPAAAPAAA
eukprot:1757537-Prymnesium_polylepis.1